MISETRTEQDFALWLETMELSDTEDRDRHIVTDNLNAHMSESAVRFIATIEGTSEEELGIKKSPEC